ncbi:hypothetical protein FOL47_001972 [Perkinsus chesapeaki]|uniref:cysteine-S-conjugate beta-lyase n=1 Tax=Perkinsus chesapeaki TaxID=330153 RepID=A0A7J6N0Y8_PERCH|nr:hypothetical protein FOL47_001972 [Perkinsus chesapeaki]
MDNIKFDDELVEEDPEHVVIHRPTYPTMADVDGGGLAEGDDDDAEERGLASSIDYNQVPTYPERPTFESKPLPLRYETQCVAFDPCKSDPNHPSSMPIYQTATFVQPSIERFGPYDYTRSGNPTRTAVEQLLAGLEGAHAAFSFNTGMAALAAVTKLCDAGDEIICGDDIYGGMHRLLSRIIKRYNIKVHFVDLSDTSAVAAVLSDKTRIVHCESPSNPLMRITDLRRLSAQLKAFSSRIILSVDSTMMSPYWMQPLRLGADVVVHSATKFLLGHSDTMAGFVCTSTQQLSSAIAFVQNAEGTACSPFDCWLILRGLKTLCIRQDRAEENAQKVVAFLANHPIVREPRPPKAEQLQQAVIEDEQYEDTTEKIRTPPKNDNVSEESQSRQSSPSGGQTDLTATALSKLTPSQTPRDQPRNLPENAPSEISTSASSAMPDKPVRSMATFGQSKTDRFKAMGGPSGREWPIDPTGPPSRIKGGSIMPLHQSRASAPQQQHHMSNIDPKLELVRERTPSAIIGPESTSAATRRSSTLGPGTYDPSPPSPTRCNTVIKDRVFPVLPPGLSLEGTFHPGPGAYDVSTESSAPGGTLSFQMAQRFSYGRAAEWHDIGGYEKKPQRRRIPSAVILPEGVCLSKMVRQFGPEPATYTPCHADLYRPDVGILQWSRARDVAIRYAHERLFGDSRREIDNLDSKWSALTRPNYDECIRTRKGSLVDYQLSERPAAKYPPHVPTNAGCSDNWHFYDTRPPECNEFTAFFSSKHDFDEWQRVARCRELQQGIARRRENPQAELFAYSLPDLPDGKGVTFAGACHSPTPPDNEGHILILDPQLPCRVGGSLEFQLRTGRESPTEDSGGDVLILSPRKIPKHTGGAIPYELQPARETQLFCHVAGVGSEDQVYTTQPPRETAPDDVPDECLTNFEEVERSRPLGHLPKWLLRMKNRRRSGLPVVFED